jgi:NAD(P) transhydrogenase
MQKPFDLAVIGSGPGGLRAAIQAAKLGKSVIILEKDKAGGASVHTGTIPSKSLREAALDPRTDFSAAVKRMRAVLAAESKVVLAQLKRNKVEFLKGEAQFLSANEISVKGRRIQAMNFVIATGTRPIRNPEFPFGLPKNFPAPSSSSAPG